MLFTMMTMLHLCTRVKRIQEISIGKRRFIGMCFESNSVLCFFFFYYTKFLFCVYRKILTVGRLLPLVFVVFFSLLIVLKPVDTLG